MHDVVDNIFSQFPTLVQTEISQQLFHGCSWHFVQTFMFPEAELYFLFNTN